MNASVGQNRTGPGIIYAYQAAEQSRQNIPQMRTSVSQNQGQMNIKKTVATVLNSNGFQPGTIIRTDGSYAIITKNCNLINTEQKRMENQYGHDDEQTASPEKNTPLFLLTHDKIVQPLPIKNENIQLVTLQPIDASAHDDDYQGQHGFYPNIQSGRNEQSNANKLIKSLNQSEHDIEDRQIEIPKLIGTGGIASAKKAEGKVTILTSKQKNDKRSLSKSNLISHDSSLKAMPDPRGQGSPQLAAEQQNVQSIKDGKIFFTKNPKDIDVDESSIFKVYTNDEQFSGFRILETPSLSKETSQLGFLMAPAEIASLNIGNMTSATTNATIIKPQLTPQKLQAFNINDLALGQKINAKNIMMIKKFDLDGSVGEPLDNELEINLDCDDNTPGGGLSEDKNDGHLTPDRSEKKFNDTQLSSKKKSKNQKRKLIASSTQNPTMTHNTNSSSKRQNSRKISHRKIGEQVMGQQDDRLKRKPSQTGNAKVIYGGDQYQLNLSTSPNSNKNQLASEKKSGKAQPLWLQNGVLVCQGSDQIDPVLRNSTKNGNIPNSLLFDALDSTSATRSRRTQNQASSASKANIFSPTRLINNDGLETFNQMLSRTVDKKSRQTGESQQNSIEGIFMIDGQIVRLDNEGKIIQPIYSMSKDIPIHSVFEMSNAKKDPQLTKMNQIHNKLKLMRGFNKSQNRRNVREVPSMSNKKGHNNPPQQNQEVLLEQRRATNNSSKLNGGKQSKSVAKPQPTVSYPYTNPYGQHQPVDYLLNVVKPLNGQLPVNTDLQDILESSHRDRTMSPNRKSQGGLNQQVSDSKKPPIPAVIGVNQSKMATKTPMKPSSSKFPDYQQSPMKVNDILLSQQRAQQNLVHTEKKQPTGKLQSLEAMKQQQIHQQQIGNKMQPQQLRSLPYRVQKSSSTHVKRSFTSLPEIKNKEQGKNGQQAEQNANQNKPPAQQIQQPTGQKVMINQQKRQSSTQDRGRMIDPQMILNENSNDNNSMAQEKLFNEMGNQFGCQSDTMLSSINNDQAQIEKFQNEMYERTKFGDLVIYDNECRIMTFRSKNSKKASEVYLFQDLDFQELKKQLEASSNIPAIGCNEVKMKDNSGKPIFQQPENAALYDLFNTAKCKYSIIQGHKDQDKVNQIRKKFGKLKNVKEFNKKLYIPHMANQYCLFYGRFESGNLQRVIQRNQGTHSMEFDIYLQPDTNSEGLMHWYYFKMMTKGLDKGTRIKINIRNLHRSRSLYEQGMLPRICFEDTLRPDGNQGSGGDSFYPNLLGDSVSDDGGASISVMSEDSVENYTQNGTRRIGWHIDKKVTYGINFFKTDQNDCFDHTNYDKNKQFYTLSFIYEVQQVNESVFMAYDKPYTYSQDLKKFVDQVRNDPSIIDICQVSTLCKSMGGNDVRLITITDNVRHSLNFYESVKLHLKKDVRDRFSIKQEIEKLTDEQRKKKFLNYFKRPEPKSATTNPIDTDRTNDSQDNKKEKPKEEVETRPEILTRPENAEIDIGIESKYQKHLIAHHGKNAMIITARVHPGEIQASYALEGVLRFLLSDFKKAKELREKYIFYVVPMLNPDGVIQGNHRTDLAGFDMNRRWLEPSPWIHPIMYACKFLTRMIKEERQIDVFCDIHGHFQATGGFAYCCSYYKPGHQAIKHDQENEAQLRVIPSLMNQRNPLFSIDQCTFNMETYKNGSARQVMFNEFKIMHSYTLENSFFSRFTDADIDNLQECIQARHKKLEQKKLKRSQSECSTNSSGEPREPLSAQKKQGSCSNSPQKIKENVKTNKSMDKPFKILEEGSSDYIDKFGMYQKKDMGIKKASTNNNQLRRAQNKESSLAREKSSKNLNLSVGEINRSHSVSKQEQQPDNDQRRSPSPRRPYPNSHHFSSHDHEKLGVDMCIVFHKLFIKSQKNGPGKDKAQEDIQKILAKFYQKNPNHNKLQMANVQSISAAYGSGPHQKFRR